MKTSAEAGDETGVSETHLGQTGIKEGRVSLLVGLGFLSLVFGFVAMVMFGISGVSVEAGKFVRDPSQEPDESVFGLAAGAVFTFLSVLAVASIPKLLGPSETFRTRSLASIGTALVVILLLAGAWHFLSELSNQPLAPPLPMD